MLCLVAESLADVEGLEETARLVLDLFLEKINRVDELLGAGRTAGNIDVDGHDLIDALHQGIVVEDAARGGASAHGNDPLGLGHLVVEAAEDGSHFLRDAPGHDHEVGLARRGAEHLGAEASDVEARSAHGHHFNGAAGQPEGHGPHGVLANPVNREIERSEKDAFRRLVAVVGFSYFEAVFYAAIERSEQIAVTLYGRRHGSSICQGRIGGLDPTLTDSQKARIGEGGAPGDGVEEAKDVKGVNSCGCGIKFMRKQAGFGQNLRYLCAFMKMIRKHSPAFYIICPAAACGPPVA